MTILDETRTETERLLAAGAALAKGDFRVAKLLPALDEAAVAAPVVARVASALRRALGEDAPAGEGEGTLPEPERAAEALMEAHSLLGAIAATQAEAGFEGELVPFAANAAAGGAAAKLGKQAGYGSAQPLAAALTAKGSGRLSVLEAAEKEGLLGDFRLLPDLASALGDGSSDIAKIAQRALRSFGPAATPALRELFDPAGGARDQRALELLVATGSVDGAELLALARAESLEVSGQVRAAAIGALSERGAEMRTFLPLAKDRKKEVRLAAAAALCRFDDGEAATAAAEVLAQDPEPSLVEALRASTSPRMAATLLERARAEYEAAVHGLAAGKPDKKAVERCLASLSPLPVTERSAVLDFLLSACEALDGLPAGAEREALLRQCLGRILGGDEGSRCCLLALSATERPENLAYRFFASLLTESPANCFLRFSTILEKGSKDPRCAALLGAWRELTDWSAMASYGLPGFSGPASYDIRWREEFCRLDEVDLVCRFEPRGMPKQVMRYLEKKAESPQAVADSIHAVLRALAQAGSPRRVELCLESFKASLDPKARQSWRLRSAAASALLELGAEQSPALSKLAAKEKNQDLAAFLLETANTLAARA